MQLPVHMVHVYLQLSVRAIHLIKIQVIHFIFHVQKHFFHKIHIIRIQRIIM